MCLQSEAESGHEQVKSISFGAGKSPERRSTSASSTASDNLP